MLSAYECAVVRSVAGCVHSCQALVWDFWIAGLGSRHPCNSRGDAFLLESSMLIGNNFVYNTITNTSRIINICFIPIVNFGTVPSRKYK